GPAAPRRVTEATIDGLNARHLRRRNVRHPEATTRNLTLFRRVESLRPLHATDHRSHIATDTVTVTALSIATARDTATTLTNGTDIAIGSEAGNGKGGRLGRGNKDRNGRGDRRGDGRRGGDDDGRLAPARRASHR
ncbi:hypothetical protein H8N01_00005, partial [Streptomyces sp. AC536]|uniref:hypothetical protein n=1 Tax=Streptomyces buecherae TaxID=2763006 RepID=UPI00164E51D6